MSPEVTDFVTVDGMKIAVRQNEAFKSGAEGTPVLCIHGLAYGSYAYRYTLKKFEEEGVPALSFDWPAHGSSDQPATSQFPYTEDAFVAFFEKFLQAVGIRRPFHMIVHGYILNQYALLYAIRNPDDIDRIVFHPMPLDTEAKLRPEFAAYKNPLPFLRPKKPINGAYFSAAGSCYVVPYADATVYEAPLRTPAGEAAIKAVLDTCDFPLLLKKVDEGFKSWRKPGIVLFGNYDPFMSVSDALKWLGTKRTCIKCHYSEVSLGHVPFEELPDAVHVVYQQFFAGKLDKAITQDDIKTLLPNPMGREIKRTWAKKDE